MWTAYAAASVEARIAKEGTVFSMHRRPHWEAIADDVATALATEPTDISEVIVRQEALQVILEHLPGGKLGPAACFNTLYRTITGFIEERSKRDEFADNPFLVALDVEFARRYFAAVGAAAAGGDAKLPRVWGVLFDAGLDLSPMASAALGVNAHINYDLAFALVGTLQQLGDEQAFPADDSKQMAAYLAVNEIFHQAMPGLMQEFAGKDHYVRAVIRLAGHLGDVVADGAVDMTRGLAWDVAKAELWPVRGKPDDLTRRGEELDMLATGIGWLVRSPLADVALGHGHPGS
jgi:hypothetical protein